MNIYWQATKKIIITNIECALWNASFERKIFEPKERFLLVHMRAFLWLLRQLSEGGSSLEVALVFTKNDNDEISNLGELAYVSTWHLPVQNSAR